MQWITIDSTSVQQLYQVDVTIVRNFGSDDGEEEKEKSWGGNEVVFVPSVGQQSDSH